MTPYPHPQVNLDIFQARLSTDISVDNATYAIQCSAPVPTSTVLAAEGACDAGLAAYNTLVDMAATGALTGEVDRYPYDRLDLSQLTAVLAAKGIDTTLPFLKGAAVTVQDLLTDINDRWGTSFDLTDIVPIQIPVCTCVDGDGGIGVALQAAPLSLIYTGQLTIYVMATASLSDLVIQPYIASLSLPALTP